MPLYEYRCEKCGQLFEVRQKFADEPLTLHEECNGKVHRLISAPALQFKGSGFYITDYAKGSAPGAKNGGSAGGESSDGSKAASSGEKAGSGDKASNPSSETKPAASTPSSSEKKSD